MNKNNIENFLLSDESFKNDSIGLKFHRLVQDLITDLTYLLDPLHADCSFSFHSSSCGAQA